ncbi:MAG TPA: flavodoxin domain-containing protein [Chitinophagaceae bacterium]|nr:flavodoxin domain-containing protein [Chitinophagaceae bacterium]
MKGLVIYKGRYGATKQYAAWIGNELGLPVASADRFPKDQLKEYDYFIIGSSVYIGKLEIRKWLKNNFNILINKKNFLFQVAASPVTEMEKRDSYNAAGIPVAILNKAKIFFLPGRMIMRNLSWFDRFMLRMGARLTKDPAERTRMLTDFNDVKKEHLLPLINAIKAFTKIDKPEKELV